MRRILISLVLSLLALGGLIYLLRGPIALAIVERIADRTLAQDVPKELPDGLAIGLCGAGSPMADPDRAGPCVAVVAGGHLYVVDIGEGGQRNLNRMGLSPGRVEALFLTHFHSDHIDSMGALMLGHWAAGAAKAPLDIYGPEGVAAVVAGFNAAYTLDSTYRTAHHGADIVPPEGFGGLAHPFTLSGDAPEVIFTQGDLKVSAFVVNHKPIDPAVGYVFEYKGRKIVISGDTAKSPNVQAAAAGADVLAHEALSEPLVAILANAAKKAGKLNVEKIMHDIPNYHTSPEQAAEIARDAGVGYLLYYHIVPGLPLPGLDVTFLGRAAEIYKGPMRIGHDGDMLILPAGSKVITLTRRF
jgi:ribonuclease Z